MTIGSGTVTSFLIGRSGSIIVAFLKIAPLVAWGLLTSILGISIFGESGDFGDETELLMIRGADCGEVGDFWVTIGLLTGSGEVFVGIATTIGSCCLRASIGRGSLIVVSFSMFECALILIKI